MDKSSFEINITGAEKYELRVFSDSMDSITNACYGFFDNDAPIPLCFEDGLRARGLSPLEYILIGARLSPNKEKPSKMNAEFKTAIQLGEDLLIDFENEHKELTKPNVTLKPYSVLETSTTENCIGLYTKVYFNPENDIPALAWTEFIQDSFHLALRVLENYRGIANNRGLSVSEANELKLGDVALAPLVR